MKYDKMLSMRGLALDHSRLEFWYFPKTQPKNSAAQDIESMNLIATFVEKLLVLSKDSLSYLSYYVRSSPFGPLSASWVGEVRASTAGRGPFRKAR